APTSPARRSMSMAAARRSCSGQYFRRRHRHVTLGRDRTSEGTMAETTVNGAPASAPRRKPWYTVLYIQVLIAIAIGIAIGHLYPTFGTSLKPLGDAFIALIKMMIAPVIFCTVVHGIASMSDLKKIGRVGVKTLFYFEAVSTFALAIGLF